MMTEELLTADEAASILKVTRRTILRWSRERKIESVRVSRKVILFTAEAIEGFLKVKTIGVEPAAAIKPRPEIRSTKGQTKQRDKKNSRAQSWQDLRKEVLSWIKQDQE